MSRETDRSQVPVEDRAVLGKELQPKHKDTCPNSRSWAVAEVPWAIQGDRGSWDLAEVLE